MRNAFANSSIGVVCLVAVVVFAATFLPSQRFYDFVLPNVDISHWSQRVISVVLLFIAWHLYMRKRFAWMLCIILLPVSLILHFVLPHHPIGIFVIVLEIYALAILLVCHGDFKRPLHRLFRVKNLSTEEKAHARDLVLKYGQNSCAYLVLEDDKILFFGKEVDGVVAYGVVGNVITVCGDPICAPEVFVRFLAEFKAFCNDCSYQCIFLGTSEAFIEQYTLLGYHHVKAGEEARFHLADYQLAGGQMAKLRALINHANKELTTHEYKPTVKKDEEIEKGIKAVTDAWLEGKKSGQLGFSVGGDGLNDPLDRRYFYATDAEGKIVAFNVFLPYVCMADTPDVVDPNNADAESNTGTVKNKTGTNGYLADVTRRIPHSPGGSTEKLIYDGFMVFKEEGMEWGSMGMATFSNVHEDGVEEDITAKLLEFIYEKCNRFYGFKDLHRAKEKYNPTFWAPGYFVYSSKNITPEMAFASIKVQNPGGVKDFVLSSVKAKFS